MKMSSEHSKVLELFEYLVIVAVAVAIAFFIRTFVAEVYEVPTGSMLNTIQLGDRLVGEKLTYRFGGTPQVGDVVTFTSPQNPDTLLVKRVIATAGQTVDLRDGAVYVDGQLMDEPYTEGKPTYSLADRTGAVIQKYPYTVPEGHIFVMGDNRTNSLDSRYFGAVSVSTVTSKAMFIFWPFDHARGL